MSIRFCCVECAESYDVGDDLSGKTIRCRECSAYGRVPELPKPVAPKPTPSPAAKHPVTAPSLKLRWQSVPVWGTFFILLFLFLAALAWGGWMAYDHFYRQPRMAEMRELFKEWDLALRQTAYARSMLGLATKDAEASIREVDDFRKIAGKGADNAWADKQRQFAQGEESYWQGKIRECGQKAEKLDAESRQRFGVGAAELPRLIGN